MIDMPCTFTFANCSRLWKNLLRWKQRVHRRIDHNFWRLSPPDSLEVGLCRDSFWCVTPQRKNVDIDFATRTQRRTRRRQCHRIKVTASRNRNRNSSSRFSRNLPSEVETQFYVLSNLKDVCYTPAQPAQCTRNHRALRHPGNKKFHVKFFQVCSAFCSFSWRIVPESNCCLWQFL